MTARKWLLVGTLLLPGAGLIVFFMGAVLYMAVAQSFGYFNLAGDSSFSLQFWQDALGKKLYFRSVRYSLYIGFISAILSVALAYPIALWLRKPFPGSLTVSAVLKAPILVHGLVAAFLLLNIIAYHGLLNQILQGLGLTDGPMRLQNDKNAISVLILQVWKNMPMALLLLSGAVQGIGDDLINAARDLGAGSWARLRKVIAPLSLGAMQASLVIIFIGALADFSFHTIIGPTNRQSLTQHMVFYTEGGRWNDAGVVGVTIMVLSLAGALLLTFVSQVLFGRRKG